MAFRISGRDTASPSDRGHERPPHISRSGLRPPLRSGAAWWPLSGLLAERRVLEHGFLLAGGVGDQHRALALLDRLLGDDALLDVAAGGQLELDVEQRLLEDRAETAGAR